MGQGRLGVECRSKQWPRQGGRACAKELWQESTVIQGSKPTLVWLEPRVGRGVWGGWAREVGRIPHTMWSAMALAQFLIYQTSTHLVGIGESRLALRGGCSQHQLLLRCTHHPHHLTRTSLWMRTLSAQVRYFFLTQHCLCGHSSTEVSETTEISINPIRVTAGFLETF